MTRLARRLAALGLAVGLVCPAAREGAAATQATQLAAACASCHGGQAPGIPPIAGLDERRIEQSMLAYRSGERASQIMHVIASALSPDEIASIARYLSRQQKADRQ